MQEVGIVIHKRLMNKSKASLPSNRRFDSFPEAAIERTPLEDLDFKADEQAVKNQAVTPERRKEITEKALATRQANARKRAAMAVLIKLLEPPGNKGKT